MDHNGIENAGCTSYKLTRKWGCLCVISNYNNGLLITQVHASEEKTISGIFHVLKLLFTYNYRIVEP